MRESQIEDCGKLRGKERKCPLEVSRKGLEFGLGLKEGERVGREKER